MEKSVVILRSTSVINDSRTIKVAKTLVENGYRVTILGWDRTGILNEDRIVFGDGHADIYVYKHKAKYGGGVKLLVGMLGFEVWLYRKLNRLKNRYSIIHSCDLDTGFIGNLVAHRHNKKHVYDIFDYYIDSRKLPKQIEKGIENSEINVINKAHVTIICGEWRERQLERATPKKLIVVYNTPYVKTESAGKKVIKSDNDKIKLTYVGILQDKRLLREVLGEIKKNPSIELHIGGFGALSEEIEKNSAEYENIFFYGSLNYDDVLALEKDSSVLFATYDPAVRNHQYSAPNKVFEAMALGLPIIVCKNTGIDELVTKHKTGVAISYDAKEFIACVYELISDKDNLKEMKNRALALYNSTYNWNTMEQLLLKTYSGLAEEDNHEKS